MTLTEQWKKGELPAGYYYVKNEFGNIFPTEYSEDYDCISDVVIKDFFMAASEIVEIIDKVPSYEELKEAYGCILHSEVLRLKNIQLKKWLEEFNLLNAVQDCKALAKLVLKLSPERKEWLEKHYGEYL